jgi:hypothetical protein
MVIAGRRAARWPMHVHALRRGRVAAKGWVLYSVHMRGYQGCGPFGPCALELYMFRANVPLHPQAGRAVANSIDVCATCLFTCEVV